MYFNVAVTMVNLIVMTSMFNVAITVNKGSIPDTEKMLLPSGSIRL